MKLGSLEWIATIAAAGTLALASGICAADPGFFVRLENTSVKYGQEGGTKGVSGIDNVNFGNENAPRIEAGYLGSEGGGIRGRYWIYDATGSSTGSLNETMGVDTYYWDAELFQLWQPTEKTELDGAIGVRFLDFDQKNNSPTTSTTIGTNFDGWGGTAALQAKRKLGIGKVYGRSRFSLLLGDSVVENTVAGTTVKDDGPNNPVQQVELALGYEMDWNFSWGQLNANLGYEWQYWTNLGIADAQLGGVGNGDVLEDVTFQGWALGIGASF